jgi:hypothetical protein
MRSVRQHSLEAGADTLPFALLLCSCQVGSNAYLTPPKAQGLAPHHDDVEIWVVQTQGGWVWG